MTRLQLKGGGALIQPPALREIEAVKLADIKGGKNYYIVDFWAKFPLPDYPDISDIPVTVIASIKQHEAPAHLLHG